MKNKDFCILLVDDEPDILEIVSYNLSSEGYKVITAENGCKGVKLAREKNPHLIILDVMMPEMNGIEACEQMRKIPELNSTIITFLTARSEDYAQMAGLEAGADDYITKPIKPKVLLSKVKALLRRFKEDEPSKNIIKLGDLIINREEYTITKDQTEILLPRKEFELLSLLASKPGKVIKREEIHEKIWGKVLVGGRTIDVHIRKLREKIGEEKIVTAKGLGYKIIS